MKWGAACFSLGLVCFAASFFSRFPTKSFYFSFVIVTLNIRKRGCRQKIQILKNILAKIPTKTTQKTIIAKIGNWYNLSSCVLNITKGPILQYHQHKSEMRDSEDVEPGTKSKVYSWLFINVSSYASFLQFWSRIISNRLYFCHTFLKYENAIIVFSKDHEIHINIWSVDYTYTTHGF